MKQTDAEFAKMVAEDDMTTASIGQMAQERLTNAGKRTSPKSWRMITPATTPSYPLAAKCGDDTEINPEPTGSDITAYASKTLPVIEEHLHE